MGYNARMPTYIMLSTLTPEGVQTIKNNPQRIREVNKEIEQLGATVKAQWATLGRFDFVNVVEAPDEQTMARVSLELGSRGTVRYETLVGHPGRRLHREPVAGEGPRRRRGRARARDRPRARGARRRRPRSCARRATPGIARDARLLDVAVDDVAGMAAAAARRGRRPRRRRARGAAGRRARRLLAARGIAAFGPTREVAQLEGSKAFAKEVMEAAGVATATWRAVDTVEDGMAAIERYPVVLKFDGLAAGKGVVIAADEAQARGGARGLPRRASASATGRVVVEEALEGEELSLLALCDGETAVPMAPAQDYKRIFDGDRGPNTGGMGSYSPVPGIDRARVEEYRAHDPPAGGRRAAPPRHARSTAASTRG